MKSSSLRGLIQGLILLAVKSIGKNIKKNIKSKIAPKFMLCDLSKTLKNAREFPCNISVLKISIPVLCARQQALLKSSRQIAFRYHKREEEA